MDLPALGILLGEHLDDLAREGNVWQGVNRQRRLYVMADQDADRMRVMTPVGRLSDTGGDTDADLLRVLLEANFDRALDARYALHDGVLWSAFIHPLASLGAGLLADAIAQVVTLADNTGTTFASSDLFFGQP